MEIAVRNPFFADLNDDTNPFKDSTIFRPGLTINDIPPRPTCPPSGPQSRQALREMLRKSSNSPSEVQPI
jgi:hypothetical protein